MSKKQRDLQITINSEKRKICDLLEFLLVKTRECINLLEIDVKDYPFKNQSHELHYCLNCIKSQISELTLKHHFLSEIKPSGYEKYPFKIIDSSGYIELRKNLEIDLDYFPIKEHRYVMEKFLGRKLSKNEIIHHKDQNKTNNKVENLQIMNPSEHAKTHSNLCKKKNRNIRQNYL